MKILVTGANGYLGQGFVFPSARKKEQMLNGDFKVYCDNCKNQLKLVATTEDCFVQPNSLYAFAKYTQEKMLQTTCPALNADYTIFRFQNVYGVGQSLKNLYTGILSIFSTLLLENMPFNIFEDGLTAFCKWILCEDKDNSGYDASLKEMECAGEE